MNNFYFRLIGLVVAASLYSITSVPKGQVYIVERFGRYSRTLHPGINLIMPIIERVGHKLNVMEQVRNIPPQEVMTRDNVKVIVDSVVTFQVVDAFDAAYKAKKPDQAILTQAANELQSVAASMEAEELRSRREIFGGRLFGAIDAAASSWGVKVIKFEIKSISPLAVR